MCGIVGAFGPNLSGDISKVFAHMLLLDFVRGMHSTGVAFKSGNFTHDTSTFPVRVFKATGHPMNLHTKFPEVFDERVTVHSAPFAGKKLFMMGHNRSATIGAINAENAHPFIAGNTVLTHNGTIRSGFTKEEMEAIAGDTDSEALTARVEKETMLANVFKDLVGAAALAYWQEDLQQFNLYRNDERPLHYLEAKEGSTVLYASEAWMINRAITAAKVNRSQFGADIKEVPKDTRLSWVIPNRIGGEFKKTITTAVLKPFMKAPTTNQSPGRITDYTGNRGSNQFSRNQNSFFGVSPWMSEWEFENYLRNKGFTANKAVVTEENTSFKNVLDNLNGSTRLFETQEDFDSATGEGCQLCSGNLDYDDQDKYLWFDDKTPLCDACAIDWAFSEGYGT